MSSLTAPGLICFDMDGTLYHDSLVYPRIITHFFADTPYSGWIEALQAEIEAVLRGERPLRCGHFVPKQAAYEPTAPEELLSVPSEAALLLDSPGRYLDRQAYTYIGDGWTLAMYLARRIGWEGDAFWERFRKARADLLTPDYGPRPDPRLRQCLHKLREGGVVLTLCSNAREEHGRQLLHHLELDDCFDVCVFDADKPHTFAGRAKDWETRCGVPPARMLFVGDQGYYDLYAGKQLGGRTLLVSPYPAADAALWDARVGTPAELLRMLSAFTDEMRRTSE